MGIKIFLGIVERVYIVIFLDTDLKRLSNKVIISLRWHRDHHQDQLQIRLRHVDDAWRAPALAH